MSFTTANITNLLAASGLSPAESLVTWSSTLTGYNFQVYVNGSLAGVTPTTTARSLVVSIASAASGGGGATTAMIEVIGVTPDDVATDFSDQLTGFGANDKRQALITWRGGSYLSDEDPHDVNHYNIFIAPTGTIDYDDETQIANKDPIPVYPYGILSGYGMGGYGTGGYGRSSTDYSFKTDILAAGTYDADVQAFDVAGNPVTPTPSVVTFTIVGPPEPPGPLVATVVDSGGIKAQLDWTASPSA